jgi:hypothetical protein
MRGIFIVLIVFCTGSVWAQSTKKQLHVQRAEQAPNIDGQLNDGIWQNAEIAQDFVMFKPGSGNPEPENQKTIVKISYDNEAVYVGAYLYDNHPETIPMQFTTRDNFGQTDFLLVSFNPNNDGINDTEFVVMSTGTQADAKVSSTNGEDFGWSAVWESAIQMHADGWSVEMKIPFSALRFSNTDVAAWGMNIHRRIQSTKEQYCWNFIDKTQNRYTEYAGELIGIKDVDTPIRLSFYPYAQGTYVYYDGSNEWKGTAGMDVKYGINDTFTLDATLIPDFGQTAYDDVVLNLGPFEQQYEEKRAFFTEGTEIFAKGYLFYSRRIGDRPKFFYDVYSDLGSNEVVKDNPEKTQMLNAIKLSGRTQDGWGLGLFNAITNTTRATIKNTLTDSKRTFITSPFTNYSALVVDKEFKNTSSISLVNSNVWRNGAYYDANVTSLTSDIRLFKKKYALGSDFSISQKYGDITSKAGFQGYMEFNKITGKHRWGLGGTLSDTHYDKNDFGIMYYNNFVNLYGNYSYRIFEPKGHFNSFNISLFGNYNRLYDPSVYTSNSFNLNINITNRKELSYGLGSNFHFGTERDYYEPRVVGRYFVVHPINNAFVWISTDYRKKFALDATLVYGTEMGIEKPAQGPYIEFSPRYRFTDQFQIGYSLGHDITYNGKGYVTQSGADIIFGRRDSKTYTNSINGTYNFSTKSALSLSLRHYWAPVKYTDFYTLNENGILEESTYTGDHDINFNAWNLDTTFTWEFAPGSQLIALYRNSLYKNSGATEFAFGKNITNLFDEPLEHQFSIKFVYYIDYNNLINRNS